jgi:hypothetical protein
MGQWRYRQPPFLTSVLYGGEWSASRPGRLTPVERAPGTHWTGDWVGSRAGLWTLWSREKSLTLARNQTPDVQPVARRYTD